MNQKQIFARIIATGSYSPENIVSNNDFAAKLDTSDEWIKSRTGIKQRRFALNQSTSQLAYFAAVNALKNGSIDISQLDMLIVATSTPDRNIPATASLVAEKLGSENIACFDINSACSGFIYALNIVNALICSKQAKTILLIGAETMSQLLDMNDRSTCVLFGDGAGAFVIQADKNQGIIDSQLHALPQYSKLLYTENKEGKNFIRMQGKEVFKIAVNELGNMAPKILAKNGFCADQLDWFIPHQANIRIIEAVRKKLNLPKEKVITTIDKFGNTSAASIAQAYDDANQKGKFKKGDLILLEAFGAGFSWGSVLLKV